MHIRNVSEKRSPTDCRLLLPLCAPDDKGRGDFGLLGYSAGGRPGERLMQRLGMPVGDDTILRQLKRDAAVIHRASEIRVVGIDDWSWRRATRYGTIMVDLERRSVVDILDDRSVDNAARWLRNHPSVEVVSRDRCGLYAQAVREGAPQAQQVADRFHLVQNLRTAIEEQMSFHGRASGRSILSEDAIVDAATHRRRARLAHRQSRQEIFEMLHALRQEGLSYSEIARRTGYERRSVAKWLKFKAPPAFAEMRRLAMRFNGILRSKRSETLDPWIDDAIDSELIPIMRFARVLRRDIDAVNNAIELPWSNGQAEGQINRLKTLKRAMYGRAGPELLRARMLPPRHTN